MMFYEESQFNEQLKCPICRFKYEEPRALPCGEVICEICALVLKHTSDPQTGYVKCELCFESHIVPEKGFPISKLASS